MESALESLLFISGDEGITEEELIKILEIDNNKLNETIDNLKQEYDNLNRGIEISYLGNRYKLVTKIKNKNYIQKLVTKKSKETLSDSALETLAIIAYNQPITRNDVDEIRGVSSAYLIRKLVCKNLVTELGRSEIAGRPILYGTTSMFLDYFGLKTIKDLPIIEVEKEEKTEDLYNSKYNEEN